MLSYFFRRSPLRRLARQRFFRPRGEMLEDRRVLAAFVIDGTAGADVITLKESGASYVATVNGGTPIVALASTVTAISVNGLAGADRLDVDYSGGNFGGLTINYAGGSPTTNPGDSLRTFGGSFVTGTSTPTSGSAGSIAYAGGSTGASTISYSGLEPIDDLNTVTNYTINATNALNFINIVNGPVVSGTQTTQVNDGAVLFEKINFANKTNVVVNALDGSDQIAINNSLKGAGLASLVVNGGNGDDQFNIHGPGLVAGTTYSFNGGADNDLFSVSGGLLGAAAAINGDAHTGATPSSQDRLTVNSFASNVTQTATQLLFAGGATITFGTLEQINLNNLNTLAVSGTGGVDTVSLNKPSATTFRSVLNTSIEVNFDLPLAAAGAEYFANLAGGSDTLTIDNTGRIVNLHVAFNAGSGSGDTLNLFGNPGTPVARETYIVGATQDAGRAVLDPDGNLGYLKTSFVSANGDELDVSFNSAEAIRTDVPATIFDAVLSAASDSANLEAGATLNGSQSMLLNANSATFLDTQLANKATIAIAGFSGNDSIGWNVGTVPAGVTNVEMFGFVPPGLGVDDNPASAANRDSISVTETTAAARHLEIGYSATASVIDIAGLPVPLQIGTAETVNYVGTAANNDLVTIVDNIAAVGPARVFNLTASGASYTRNGGVGSSGESGPDLSVSGLGGTSTPLTVDGNAPAAAPGDQLFYDGPFIAQIVPANTTAGNITATGVIGVHYQNFEGVSKAGILTWDGGGTTNDWSDAANWNPADVPEDGAELIFPAGVPANSLANNNNLAGLDLKSLTFTGGGYSITGNPIALSGGLTNSATSGGTITFAPDIASGVGGVSQSGTTTLIFHGANSFTGTTTISAGTLLVNGNSSASPVVVSGGTVGGTGTLGDVSVTSARVAPGTSIGVISTGNLQLNAGTTLDVEITNANANGFDRVSVTGGVTIGTTGSGVALNITKAGTVSLADGQQLALIANDGAEAIQGTFKSLPEGANLGSNFLGSGLTAKISYKGFTGTQNDVVLTMSPGSLFPWHNDTPGKANDVRGANSVVPDGQVVADDALAVINYINANGSGPVPENAVLGLPFGFLDTTKDNQIVADDVLAIINLINAGLGGEAEGEMDRAAVADAAFGAPVASPLPFSAELLLLLATDLASQPAARRRG